MDGVIIFLLHRFPPSLAAGWDNMGVFAGERQGEYHEWMNEWMNDWKKKILPVFQKSASKDTSDMIHQKVHVVPMILCSPLTPSNPEIIQILSLFFSSNLV